MDEREVAWRLDSKGDCGTWGIVKGSHVGLRVDVLVDETAEE